MGILSDEYFNALDTTQPRAVSQQPSIQPVISEQQPTRLGGEISLEEQTKRFGAPVGSEGYNVYKSQNPYATRLPRELLSVVGIQLPPEEEYDKMSRTDQSTAIVGGVARAAGHMIAGLPREIIKAPLRAGYSIVKPWMDLARGKPGTFASITAEAPPELPWLGSIPTYFHTYDEAKKSGMGTLASTLMTGSLALGDVTIVASLAEAMTTAFRPKGKIGGEMQNAKPISMIPPPPGGGGAGAMIKQIEGSINEYYSLPKTTAKKLGGSSGNTFLKLSPTGDGTVELSLVQMRSGLIQKGIDYIKDKTGTSTKIYKGDFGPEIKLQSQIIPIEKAAEDLAIQTKKIAIPENIQKASSEILDEFTMAEKGFRSMTPEGEFIGVSSTFPQWVPQEMRSRKLFDSFSEKLMSGKMEFSKPEQRLLDVVRKEVADRAGVDINMIDPASLIDEFKIITTRAKPQGVIPPAPLKGFENKPITSEQLATFQQISEVNGINPSIRDAIIRTVTGKNTFGELTQAEYVQAAQTLGMFNNMAKYAPEAPGVNIVSQYLAPQRHWMRTYEEKSGIPLYSEVYVPMEEGIRLRNVFRNSYRNQAREIFGRFEGVGYGEERRLISAYMRGERDAILKNETLDSVTKGELIEVADKMRVLYDKIGPQLEVPIDIFLKDYQPQIQNIGGIHQLYKEGSEIPKQLEFFAKFKRKGNLQGVQVDDALALFDIYINAGSNKTFLNPALERIGALSDTLPSNLKGSVRSYVQEKLGYGGRMEQFLDEFIPGINKKLGTNLPPDAARQLSNLTLSTMYSGLLSSPATWFRQTFQYPLFGYARLGPKNMGYAIQRGLSAEGIAEARQAGFLVELGVPYGEELAKEITLGGKVGNTYKNATQKVIAPNSMADNGMRSIVFAQAKKNFDDAFEAFNSGKITWEKMESEMDFRSLSSVDQNIIRKALQSGDINSARNNYIREIIDDTNFPYRKAASSRIGYGLAGKVGTSLLQWPIEAAHVLKKWTVTGQWDKLIRFYAASSAIQRTMQETFGFDFTRSLFLGPFNNFYSPFVKTALDSINAFTAFMQDNREEMNKNADSVARTLKSAGIPAGVELQNIHKFWRSYNRGSDASGQYSVLNDKNEVRYQTDFAGLFWGQLMGFPTEQKESEAKLTRDIRNAQFDRGQVKERILELLQQEKYDEAGEMMSETGIAVTPQDMDDYFIPYNQRVFNALPAQLKAQFAPRVFDLTK